MNYQEALDWLYSTQDFGIKLGLEAPKRLLKEFLAYPPFETKVIHVAGTNGKGSTCALIDALARGLGERPGLFTSPHLVSYRERIRVNTQDISEERCASLLTELRELVSDWDHHPTFFELTLALAMRHFRECRCSLIILETGMGGRLDATTAVPADVCVLTPIALDHQKWLGNSLAEIAAEKAAIAVPGKPLITALQDPEAEKIIKQVANEARSPLSFTTAPLTGYHLSLAGSHQKENAALACDALSAAGYHLTFDIVSYALSRVTWPGRFEEWEENLILDAAHNPHAARTLVQTWKEQYGGRKGHLLFGAVADKETSETIEILSEIAEVFHYVAINSPRALSTEDLIAMHPGQPHRSVPAALDALRSYQGLKLVTGSIFLLGEVKSPTRRSSQ